MSCGGASTRSSGSSRRIRGWCCKPRRRTVCARSGPNPRSARAWSSCWPSSASLRSARAGSRAPIPDSPLRLAAYFSMEYMLSEALPIYSGGLGNVAGDQLKAASDLGVPVVGVGLLYQQGYFRQEIDRSTARRRRSIPSTSPGQLPIRPVREANGEWLRLPLATAGPEAVGARVAGAGGARHALPARYQRPRQSARVSRHHQRALRRRTRDPHHARKSCWASADGACCARWASTRRSAI